MNTRDTLAMDRRSAIKWGTALTVGATLSARWESLFALEPGEEALPFLNEPNTPPARLDWVGLKDWLTPQDQVFNVQHYSVPEIAPEDYQLTITGAVENPRTYSLEQLRALPSVRQPMTLECAGNGASKGFSNAVYNSEWTGAALGPILEAAGLSADAEEVVFLGADTKVETLREGSRSELSVEVPFGRSLSVEDAMNEPALIAYARNDAPLEVRNGAPVRLIMPGWYGVANVKWLTRIEVRKSRYMGRYMARDYVTVRGEEKDGKMLYHESSVAKMNLKSVVARVSRKADGRLSAFGAVWGDGTPIERVEVSIDGGAWRVAAIDVEPFDPYSWRFFRFDLGSLAAGTHRIVSRATDVKGRVQPTNDAPEIANKKTYWEAYAQWPREFEI